MALHTTQTLHPSCSVRHCCGIGSWSSAFHCRQFDSLPG